MLLTFEETAVFSDTSAATCNHQHGWSVIAEKTILTFKSRPTIKLHAPTVLLHADFCPSDLANVLNF